jgi:hypothetical protein
MICLRKITQSSVTMRIRLITYILISHIPITKKIKEIAILNPDMKIIAKIVLTKDHATIAMKIRLTGAQGLHRNSALLA